MNCYQIDPMNQTRTTSGDNLLAEKAMMTLALFLMMSTSKFSYFDLIVMSNPNALLQKLWKYSNILRDDGLSYGDYPSTSLRTGYAQLTFLLFLKMADEQAKPPFNKPLPIPMGKDWPTLWRRYEFARRLMEVRA